MASVCALRFAVSPGQDGVGGQQLLALVATLYDVGNLGPVRNQKPGPVRHLFLGANAVTATGSLAGE